YCYFLRSVDLAVTGASASWKRNCKPVEHEPRHNLQITVGEPLRQIGFLQSIVQIQHSFCVTAGEQPSRRLESCCRHTRQLSKEAAKKQRSPRFDTLQCSRPRMHTQSTYRTLHRGRKSWRSFTKSAQSSLPTTNDVTA